MMINVNRAISYAKEVKELGGRELIIAAIADACKKHWKNAEPINERERFLCSLVYSEFLAEETTEGDYWQAECARQGYLKILGLDGYELLKDVELCFQR
jgi:hypothetical protein